MLYTLFVSLKTYAVAEPQLHILNLVLTVLALLGVAYFCVNPSFIIRPVLKAACASFCLLGITGIEHNTLCRNTQTYKFALIFHNLTHNIN